MQLLDRVRRWQCCWIVVCTLSLTMAAAAVEPVVETDSPESSSPATVLEDPPEALIPKTPRTDADNDRIEALALFAAARMKEHQGDDAGALRLYQRALRYDPDSLAVLRQIVPLALKLDRIDEFLRYAVKIAEQDASNSALLRQLADHLASQGNFSRAVSLYEQVVAQYADQEKSGTLAVLLNQLGRLYFLEGRFDEAAESFAVVVDALEKPDEYKLRGAQRKMILADAHRSYELFGTVFLRAGQLDRAAAAYAKAHEVSPDEAVHAYHLARIAARRNQPEEALAQLEIYLSANQSSAGTAVYRLLEEVLQSLDRADELTPRLAELYQDDPRNRPLAEFLADRHRADARWEMAEPIYAGMLEQIESELFDHPPEVADLRGQHGPAYRAGAETALRGLTEIYRQTENVEKLFPILARTAAASGGLEMLGTEVQSLAGSKTLLRRLIEHARGRKQAGQGELSYGAALATASLALEAGWVEDGDEFFDAAVRANEELADQTLMAWGLGLLMIDRYGEAADVFRRGIDAGRMPGDPRYHFFLSGALEMSGRTDQALAAAREAAQSGSDDPRIVGRVGWVLFHSQRYAEALEAYTELIEQFDPQRGSPDIRDALRSARLVLSNICVIQGDLDRAEEWLQQILDEFPEDISALNDLGYLWADRNKHLQRALSMVQQAVAAEPDNAAYRDSLGWALYRLGRFEEAIVELETAAAGADPDGVILDHLGDAYHANGDTAAALKAWKRAVKALSPGEDSQRIEALRRKIETAEDQIGVSAEP